MALTRLVTVKLTVWPFPVPDAADAGVPVVLGWLAQVAPVSVHAPATWYAYNVGPPLDAEFTVNESVALVTVQPFRAGRLNVTRLRRFALTVFCTVNDDVVPKLLPELFCWTKVSAVGESELVPGEPHGDTGVAV